MLKVWDLHKKLYDARWNGEQDLYISMEQLENEFVDLATKEGVDLETINKFIFFNR